MQVSKVQFIPNYSNSSNTLQKSQKTREENNSSYPVKSFAYRDFNINFGERLFRTPANFYAQSFNKKNMPYSMQQYLNADYEDRQNIPPAQMMKIVFDDLNDIDNLDFAKRIFSEEPLFANLTDIPNRKAKKGIVSEVEAMKSEMSYAPLFKNGKSDFGMYLLKKIYLEGKMLSEINKDFKKDLSDVYKGLITSDIDYNTFSAYGIKFPKTPFWKSFLATREDFPYVYKPRKNVESRLGGKRELTLSDILNGNVEHKEPVRPPRFKIKDNEEAKRLGDAILRGHGSIKDTEKNLRHRGVKDNDEISFVSKYLSEIMSIALEKTHASEEMRAYFDSYDLMNKKQKEKMDGYWRSNPYMRDLQSLAISDTIKLFFETYGPDGNNEEFRELLKYARNIKPLREERLVEHNRIQAEYDALAADLAAQEKPSEEINNNPVRRELSQEEIDAMIEKEALKNGAKVYTFVSPAGESCRMVLNVEECLKDRFKMEFSLLPYPVISKFINFTKHSPLATEDYKKTVSMLSSAPEYVLDQLLPVEDCLNISSKINEEFNKKYPHIVVAGEQAMAEQIIKREGGKYIGLFGLRAVDVQKFAKDQLKLGDWSEAERKEMEKNYQEYITPIKDRSDIKKLERIFINAVTSLPDSKFRDQIPMDDTDALFMANILKYPKARAKFEKAVKDSEFISKYGGSARILLKPDLPPALKYKKCVLMREDFVTTNIDTFIDILSMDFDNIQRYIKNPETKNALIHKYLINKMSDINK